MRLLHHCVNISTPEPWPEAPHFSYDLYQLQLLAPHQIRIWILVIAPFVWCLETYPQNNFCLPLSQARCSGWEAWFRGSHVRFLSSPMTWLQVECLLEVCMTLVNHLAFLFSFSHLIYSCAGAIVLKCFGLQFSTVQSLSRVWFFATPWTAARQASLSVTNSWSLPKPMSIESMMPSNHLILCRPLLLLPSVFPIIRVFSNESAPHIRWPKYWSFSFNISPSNEHLGPISFRMDWLDLLAV